MGKDQTKRNPNEKELVRGTNCYAETNKDVNAFHPLQDELNIKSEG